jgi:hypothetical protein
MVDHKTGTREEWLAALAPWGPPRHTPRAGRRASFAVPRKSQTCDDCRGAGRVSAALRAARFWEKWRREAPSQAVSHRFSVSPRLGEIHAGLAEWAAAPASK